MEKKLENKCEILKQDLREITLLLTKAEKDIIDLIKSTGKDFIMIDNNDGDEIFGYKWNRKANAWEEKTVIGVRVYKDCIYIAYGEGDETYTEKGLKKQWEKFDEREDNTCWHSIDMDYLKYGDTILDLLDYLWEYL